MSKILLLNAPISFESTNKVMGDEGWCPPLGLMCIASVLEKNGCVVKIIDIRAEKLNLDETLRIIRSENPDMIGISALTASIRSAVFLATMIKNKVNKDLPIVLGGSHISADPDIINRYECFDAGVVGEGEYEFLNLINKFKKGEKIKGIFRANFISNLDELPLPARHLVDLSKYAKNGFVISSRGCPYNCIFCGVPALGKATRYRSPQNIVDEIEGIYKNFSGKIIFLDDTLTLKRDHVLGICHEIIRRGLKVKWVASTRVDRVDGEMMKMMKMAGCEELAFGVESGNERVRNEVIKKGATDKQIKEAVKNCKKNKIKATFYLMLGFPTETISEMRDTTSCGIRLGADLIGIHPAMPMPGSELYLMAINEGKLPKNIIDEYIKSDQALAFRDFWPIYLPDNVTREEIFRLRRGGYGKFYFRPKFIFKKIKEDVVSFQKLKTDIKTAINLIRYGRSKTSMS